MLIHYMNSHCRAGCLGTHTHKRAPFDAKDLYTLLSLSEQVSAGSTNRATAVSNRSSCEAGGTASSRSSFEQPTAAPSDLLTHLLPPQGMQEDQPQQQQHGGHHARHPHHAVPHDSRAAPAILSPPSPSSSVPSSPLLPFNLLSSCHQDTNSKHRHHPHLKTWDKKQRHLLDHDSVLIAQGAILCGRKHLEAIVQPSLWRHMIQHTLICGGLSSWDAQATVVCW